MNQNFTKQLKSIISLSFFGFIGFMPLALATLNGGMISTSDLTTVCTSDDNADIINVNLTGNEGGRISTWIITDESDKILSVQESGPFEFTNAPAGTCYIWHIEAKDYIRAPAVGGKRNEITGWFAFSNAIEVVRNEDCDAPPLEVDGGTLTVGPFNFCVGDGAADNIPEGAVALSGNSGANSTYVVTDENGMILGLPGAPTGPNFEGAGGGTCFLWHLSYADGLTGLEVNGNVSDLVGEYDLSNSITVNREGVNGGTLVGGPFEFIVDGVADNIPEGAVTLSGNEGGNLQWVVTDESGKILGLPGSPSGPNFDGAGIGVCYLYNLSYADGLTGLVADANIADLDGCFDFSNFITITRIAGVGGDPANIVISEIDPANGTVELQNIGGETLDISSYWLCDRPRYEQLSELTIECGDLNLAPGAYVTVRTSSISISAAGDEMGLYASSDFSSANALVHYVIWGDRSSNTRESVAVNAGIWTLGERVVAISTNQTINYTQNSATVGDVPGDWSEASPSPCNDAGLRGNPSKGLEVKAMGNIVSDNLTFVINANGYKGPADVQIINITGGNGSSEQIEINYDDEHFDINVNALSNGMYMVYVRTENRIASTRFIKQSL